MIVRPWQAPERRGDLDVHLRHRVGAEELDLGEEVAVDVADGLRRADAERSGATAGESVAVTVSSGSFARISQTSIDVRPVLVPPCSMVPCPSRTLRLTSTPFQCSM